MNPTTIHSSEVVGQLVLIETDPIRAARQARHRRLPRRLLRHHPRGIPARSARMDHLARRRVPRSVRRRTRPHRAVRPLERVRRQSPIHDRTTTLDDLRVLQVLLPRTPDRTRPIRPCPSPEAGLRVLDARPGSQRTRRVPRPSRTLRRTRPRTRLSARVERAAHLRSPRRRHRQPRRQPRTPHPVHPSQRQQDRHHPAVAENGTGARSLHR